MEEGTRESYTHLMDTVSALHGGLDREVLARVADKWSIGVLCALSAAPGPMRFSRVRDAVGGVTQKVLTSTLRHLEEDGFVKRTVYAAVPPRVDYELTPLGCDLYRVVSPLLHWADANTSSFHAARAAYAARPGPED